MEVYRKEKETLAVFNRPVVYSVLGNLCITTYPERGILGKFPLLNTSVRIQAAVSVMVP